MKKRLLQSAVLLLLLLLNAFRITAQPGGPGDPLVSPSFTPADQFTVFQTDIKLVISNSNAGFSTEIFRSTLPDAGFELIHTNPPTTTTFVYVDTNLKPRTTYYYKARAILNAAMSTFSETFSVATASKFYPPDLTAYINEDFTVSFSLTDNSYQENYYEVFRTYPNAGDGEFVEGSQFSLLDSGQTVTFEDAPEPGNTYVYYVDASVMDEGIPIYHRVASVTVEIPTSLVTPSFTQAGYPVYENNIIFGINNPNEGSDTEIYRSRNPNTDFQLIASVPWTEPAYSDENLRPRTTYYYKLRAVMDGQATDFSSARSFASGSKFYHPELTASPVAGSDNSITLTLTDKSYDDVSYDIWRSEEGSNTATFIKGLVAADSGQVLTFVDTALQFNTTYNYRVDAYTKGPNNPFYYNVATASATTGAEIILTPPYFQMVGVPDHFPCGNEIVFMIADDNDEGVIEVWRASNPDGPFELIAQQGEGTFVDSNLGSRKTYYYQLRTVSEIRESDFSEVRSFESGAQYFDPILETSLTEDLSVEVNLIDRSYLDLSYEVYAVEEGTTNAHFTEFAQMLDSGQMVTWIDPYVLPGKRYIYYTNVTVNCDGQPIYSNVAVDTIDIPNGPAILGFMLVDADTDQDVRMLNGGATHHDEFDAGPRYNIRAVTNTQTQSVVFLLNGNRYWAENEEPYSLFGDRKGDFNFGKLKPGNYTLSATAYSGNNQKGVKGNTYTITLTVHPGPAQNLSLTENESNIAVNVFPNPVVDYATVEISGDASSEVSMQLIDQSGNTYLREKAQLNDAGQFNNEWNFEQLKRGTYFIMIENGKEKYVKRLVIE